MAKRHRKRSAAAESLSVSEYQSIARGTDQHEKKGLEALPFFLLGLFGEVGTLLSALKKRRRDREAFIGYYDTIVEEFGDVLWYLSNICTRAGLTLTDLVQRMSRKAHDWDEISKDSDVSFSGLQLEKRRGSPESQEFENALVALGGRVGLLLNESHGGRLESNRDSLSGHLVEIFRSLIEAAEVADIDLSQAAARNVAKIHSRWPEKEEFSPLFDQDFEPLEQLPRVIEMHIREFKRGDKRFVVQQCHGLNIGSRLTDNRLEEDFYRFHDAFHLGYAAILGWSPVLRGLFQVKRKSRPAIDEAEDGARAVLIEEGISTLIFHKAEKLELFENVKSLDYSMLKVIPEFVAGYEVEVCPLWQWELAILEGFNVFRQLKKHRGGIVTADLNRRTLTFQEVSR
jgi:NTP pyrophosphatase (non-canonical NTP hydrolase)